MSTQDVKNKLKTLSEGAYTERVLSQMAGTFTTLVKDADFGSVPAAAEFDEASLAATDKTGASEAAAPPMGQASPAATSPFGNLAYNINIQLPESRDPAVYNAIFKALREHFR